MREYEAMFIIRPDLTEEKLNQAAGELTDAIKKNKGEVISAAKWSDKKPLAYTIRVPATGGHAKYSEGIYYLINFKVDSLAAEKLSHSFKMNENVLRFLLTVK